MLRSSVVDDVLEVTDRGAARDRWARELIDGLDQLPETCALDVAERGAHALVEVGRLLRVSKQRIEQIELKSLRKLGKQRVLQIARTDDGES